MKTRMKKTMTWFMVVCTILSMMPVFGSAMAAEVKTVPSIERNVSETGSAAAQSDGDLEGLSTDNGFDLLLDTLKAIAANLRSLSVDEILSLPANAMDDVITYLFSVFKLLGLNLDTLYEKLASVLALIR